MVSPPLASVCPKAWRNRHPKIFVGQLAVHPPERVGALLARLVALSETGHDAELRRSLSDFLPEAQLADVERATGAAD